MASPPTQHRPQGRLEACFCKQQFAGGHAAHQRNAEYRHHQADAAGNDHVMDRQARNRAGFDAEPGRHENLGSQIAEQ
jgi:hypothetical protein